MARAGPRLLWAAWFLHTPLLYLPLSPLSQTNCKSCSWSKWSCARSWRENFRVLKVTPSPSTSLHPPSALWPESSSCAPGLLPGPYFRQPCAPCRSRRILHSSGFLPRQRLRGWEGGEEWGNGTEEGAVHNSSHLINLHR